MPKYEDPIKNAYKDLWKPGSEREQMVKELLESWGFKVEPYGFMSMSDEYNPEWAEEQGVPDLTIKNVNNQQMFIEVTGTDNIQESSRIWVRYHKVHWASKNPDKNTYCAHVISKTKTIRFVRLTEMDMFSVPRREITLHNIPTVFFIIPWNLVISKENMKKKLYHWKNDGKLNLEDFF